MMITAHTESEVGQMIKGRYVALVEIDFHADEQKGLRPFDEIKNDVVNGNLTAMLTELIIDDLDEGLADVKVTQQYADLYRAEDGEAE